MAELNTGRKQSGRDPGESGGDASPSAAGTDMENAPATLQEHDDDLRDSIAALARLATGQLALRDVLTRVAEFAVAAIPGADGAGLTLLEAGHGDTIVASAPFVADSVQHRGRPVHHCGEGRSHRPLG